MKNIPYDQRDVIPWKYLFMLLAAMAVAFPVVYLIAFSLCELRNNHDSNNPKSEQRP